MVLAVPSFNPRAERGQGTWQHPAGPQAGKKGAHGSGTVQVGGPRLAVYQKGAGSPPKDH